ncbi:MAG: beta-CASP ribonuclease aCPSF1 [Thaumarchaeota archaeon]|nr:beta-CASP ribonuclease aCPSF1 [Candidatus Calditenuaceae archaeon]MDW8043545.1 beta-CASP ribonuclease aCPSF1 [Nitrososphaerota archaeon]
MFSSIRDEILSYLATVGQGQRVATKIDYEGPRIAIYTDRPDVFADRNRIARELVSMIKKRVVIRPDPSIRAPKEEAEAAVAEAFAGHQYSLRIDEELGEVIVTIKTKDVVVPIDEAVVAELENRLRWVVTVRRAPPMTSTTVEKVSRYIYGAGPERIEILRSIGERVFRDRLFQDSEVVITFLGGAMQVGRSCLLVKTKESTVLLDAGINAGATRIHDVFPRFDSYPDLIEELDAVVVTHSHMDHHGALPLLFKYGYRGPVYMTEPTLPLMIMEHLDYLNLIGKEGEFAPYSEHDVRTVAQYTVTLRYGVVTNITPDMRLTFYNAGHIIGSAIAHLHVDDGFHNVVYTGDFKYEETEMLSPAVTKFPRVETLILESTYGATPVPYTREESVRMLGERISQTVSEGGQVLIPVPAVGRAQEIMLVIRRLFEQKVIPEVPVFLDGLLIESTAIHMMFPEYMSGKLQAEMEQVGNVFLSDYFTLVRSPQQREEVLQSTEPAIILATSGMMEGGPVLAYFRRLCGDERNLLQFVSYQVEGTLGRKILKGMREVQVMNEEGKFEALTVRMRVDKVDGFSGHSSRQQLINYLKRVSTRPKNVVFIHGEPEAIQAMYPVARKVVPGASVYAPNNLDSLRLA